MDNLVAARLQMAFSLGFHILFAVVGMGMPLLMVLAEWLGRKHHNPVLLDLARRWSKGVGILFAVGAVSGTVLSFELGLLWPAFMAVAGPVLGLPFSLEGFAFFLEAIFLGLYLYGWDRLAPWAHMACGVLVALCGTCSGIFVVTANAWMNAPVGFQLWDGKVVDVEPWVAMGNPAALAQCIHMVLAAYASVGFGVAGVHAGMLRRYPGNALHAAGLRLAFPVGAVCILLQLLSGHQSAQMVARQQPAKLAAMEGHWETERRAPMLLGGWSSNSQERTIGAIPIPWMLSVLCFDSPDAVVVGLKDIPAENRPPSGVVHLAFDTMVGLGMVMVLLALWGGVLLVKKRPWQDAPWFVRALSYATPAGFVAVEAGWVVTEVGRQPWIIQGVMRTRDAVTPMPGLVVPLVTFGALYVVLGVVVVALLRRQVFASAAGVGDTHGH